MLPKRNVKPRVPFKHPYYSNTITREVQKTIINDYGDEEVVITTEEVEKPNYNYRIFDPDKCAERLVKPIAPVMGNDLLKNADSVQTYVENVNSAIAKNKQYNELI